MTHRLLAAGAAALIALGGWAPHAGAARHELELVTPAEVNARLILPPPPAEGSPQARAELAEVRADIAGASPERLAQARWDAEHEGPELLVPTLGPAFDLARLPATARLLALVQDDAKAASSAAKKVYPRSRPWEVDPSVATCSRSDKPMGSYPSGHATLGYALALTMAQVMPQRADALLARANDYAYSRLLCAAHFHTDVDGGQALATALVYTLLSKPQFQADLAAAHTELASSGLIAR